MIALIWTLLVTLLTLIGYRSFRCYAIKRKLFWLKHIPAWPVLGNALELAGDSKGILGRISDMFNKHGNLLFVDFVGKPNIFSIDYDFNEFILTSNSILNKSTDYRFIRNWLGTGLLTSDGPKWKVRRRIMTPTFHFSILEQFVEVFEKNGNIMIDRMKKEIGNDSFDVYPYITLCALDIICESAMGVPVNAQLNENSEYVRNVKQMLKIGALRSTSILKNNDLTYLLTPDHWREKRAVKHLHAVTNSVIDARRERMEKLGREKEEEVDELGRKKRLAFLDVLLRSTQDGKPLSREDIREEVDTFMFEGHDTTASAMSFATYLLATHPKVQKKAVEEQKELFGDDFHRAANYKDLQNMKYLECVIKESLRMYPSVPMYGRHTNEDVFYKGLLAVLLVNKYRRIHSKYLRKVPQKDPNIFFGNLLDFVGSTDEFLKTLCSYVNTYGPIVRVYDGPFSEAVLTTEEKLIEYILSSTNIIDKSNQYDLFHKWLGTGLLTSSGSRWKSRRKLLTPSFHFSILENFVDIFDRQGDVFIKQLEREAGKSFDIQPYVSRCTLDIICEAAMGISINSQVQGSFEYTSAVKSICSIIINRTFSPLSPSLYPFTLNHYLEKKVLKVLHSHTDEVIDRRMKEMNLLKSQDIGNNEDLGIKKRLAFLDLLLESTLDGQLMSRRDVREEVDTFMFEGHDTTSSAITFAIYSLAMNPKVQLKAFQEQKEIFGDFKGVKPVIADLQKMKYMELVIKECLRLYPPVPLIARKLPEDLEWDETIYPEGLNLIIFSFACQRSAKYFSDPLKFIPERFVSSDGKNPYRYIPFSAGPRNCIGQKFAMLEMKSTISKVLRNFELLPATPQQELRLASEIILISKNGVRVCLKKRN